MLTFARHDLLILSEEGRAEGWRNREVPRDHDEALWSAYPDLPAICTGYRSPEDPTLLRVGFSFPERVQGMRQRIASYVSAGNIISVCTPWEIARYRDRLEGRMGDFFRSLYDTADALSLRLGVFGSTAMQLATGLPYLHDASDLDLVLDHASEDTARAFACELAVCEERFSLRADVELRLDAACYAKLKELCSDQLTVLTKGGDEPKLISRRMAWDNLSAVDDKY